MLSFAEFLYLFTATELVGRYFFKGCARMIGRVFRGVLSLYFRCPRTILGVVCELFGKLSSFLLVLLNSLVFVVGIVYSCYDQSGAHQLVRVVFILVAIFTHIKAHVSLKTYPFASKAFRKSSVI